MAKQQSRTITRKIKMFPEGAWQVLPPCSIISIRLHVIIRCTKRFLQRPPQRLNKDIKKNEFDLIYFCRCKRILALKFCGNELSLGPEGYHSNSKSLGRSNYPCQVGAGRMTGPWRLVWFLLYQQGTVE